MSLTYLLENPEMFRNSQLAKVKTNSVDFYVEFKVQDLVFNNVNCLVIQFRDMSEIREKIKLQSDCKMLQLTTSSVSHEMLTPIKCVI